MVKIFVLCCLFLISGCETVKVVTKTETVEVIRPVLYCTPPDYSILQRPQSLIISTITPDMSDGEVALRYKATIKQLQSYALRLEEMIKHYDNLSQNYDDVHHLLIDVNKTIPVP